METRTSVVVAAASLFVLMSAAPPAVAHLTAPSLWVPNGTIAYDRTPDKCRWEGSPVGSCTRSDGLSGTYRGSAGLIVSSSQFPLWAGIEDIAELTLLCVGGTDNDQDNAWEATPNRFCEVGPGLGCAGARTAMDELWGDAPQSLCQIPTLYTCDMEFVLRDDRWTEDTIDYDGPNGPTSTWTTTDANTDGKADNGNNGKLPDGRFDDGGLFGTVCHTAYGYPDWRFTGCGDSGEAAYAKDARLGTHIWISNECDFSTPVLEEATGNEWFDCTVNEGVRGGQNSVFDIVVEGASRESVDGWYSHMTGSARGGVPDPTFSDGGCDDMIVELVTSFVPTVPCDPMAGGAPGDCDEFLVQFVTETAPGFVAGLAAALAEDITDEPGIPDTTCGSDAAPDFANYGWGDVGVANLAPGRSAYHSGTLWPWACPATSAQQWGFVRDYVNSDTTEKVGPTSGWYDVR